MSECLSRRELLLRASGATLLAAGPSRLSAAVPIKIANASGALNQAMIALMQRMKFLESFGLNPEILTVADGSKIVGAIAGGSADISLASGFGQVFPAIERGIGLKILAGGALLPTIALFTTNPTVNSLKDLEGKTVGTGSLGALVHQLVTALLRKYNVDVSKVRFVNIGSSSDAFKAVTVGTVDAGPGVASLIPDAARYKVRLVQHGNMSVEMADYTYQAAWTSEKQIATNRDALVKSLAAVAKLYRFVQSPAAKEPFIQARKSVFPNAPQSDHEGEWNYVQTYKPFAVDLLLTPQRLRYMQELNVSFKVQKSILPFEKVADMSLATDALKLLR